MFGLRRRKSRAALARAELGESFDHLRQAASYATGGVNAAVAPRVRTAKAYAAPQVTRVRNVAAGGWGTMMALFMPLATVAGRLRTAGPLPDRRGGLSLGSRSPRGLSRKKARQAMRVVPAVAARTAPGGGRRRWPIAGLLVAGVIAGTVGARALRRRQQGEWEAYDPTADLDVVPGGGAASEDRQPVGHRPAGTATSNGHGAGTASQSGSAGRASTVDRASAASPANTEGPTSTVGRTSATGQAGPAGQPSIALASGARADDAAGSPAGPSGNGHA